MTNLIFCGPDWTPYLDFCQKNDSVKLIIIGLIIAGIFTVLLVSVVIVLTKYFKNKKKKERIEQANIELRCSSPENEWVTFKMSLFAFLISYLFNQLSFLFLFHSQLRKNSQVRFSVHYYIYSKRKSSNWSTAITRTKVIQTFTRKKKRGTNIQSEENAKFELQ